MTQARKRSGRAGPGSALAQRRAKYGLSQGDFDALMAASRGRCQICDVAFGEDFHIDHCHETGLVRGLLCRRCNYGIGWMDDSPPRLLSAYMYLKAAGKSDADWHHRAS